MAINIRELRKSSARFGDLCRRVVAHKPEAIVIDSNRGPGKSTVRKEIEACDKAIRVTALRFAMSAGYQEKFYKGCVCSKAKREVGRVAR